MSIDVPLSKFMRKVYQDMDADEVEEEVDEAYDEHSASEVERIAMNHIECSDEKFDHYEKEFIDEKMAENPVILKRCRIQSPKVVVVEHTDNATAIPPHSTDGYEADCEPEPTKREQELHEHLQRRRSSKQTRREKLLRCKNGGVKRKYRMEYLTHRINTQRAMLLEGRECVKQVEKMLLFQYAHDVGDLMKVRETYAVDKHRTGESILTDCQLFGLFVDTRGVEEWSTRNFDELDSDDY